MHLSKKNIYTILLIITFTIALNWVFQGIHLLPNTLRIIFVFLQPLISGLALAYILNIPTSFFESLLFKKNWKRLDGFRQKAGRPISLLLSLLIIIGIIVGVMFLIIPALVATIQQLITAIPDTVNRAQNWLNKLQENFPQLGEFIKSTDFDINQIGNKAILWLNSFGSQLLNSTVSISVGVAGFFINLVVALMLSFYIILQKEKISRWMAALASAVLPGRGAKKLFAFLSLSDRCFHNFLTGQILEATIFGALVTFALSIGRFRYAALIGILSGVSAVIPVLGAWIGGMIGALLQLTVSPKMALIFLLVFIGIQQLEGNLIYPRVVGKRVGLPPVLVLVGVIMGGRFGGIMGSFVSIPIFSIVYELLNVFVTRKLSPSKAMPADKEGSLVEPAISDLTKEDDAPDSAENSCSSNQKEANETSTKAGKSDQGQKG